MDFKSLVFTMYRLCKRKHSRNIKNHKRNTRLESFYKRYGWISRKTLTKCFTVILNFGWGQCATVMSHRETLLTEWSATYTDRHIWFFFFFFFFNNPISWIGKSVEYVGLLVLNFTAIFASLRVFFFRFRIELLRALLVFSVPFKTGRTNCKTQEDWQSRFYIITQCGYTWYIGTQQRHFCCGCW